MKARIKGTNIIVECIDTGTLINENKGIECKHSNGAIEVIPGDCLIELENDFDWKSFRAEAAKDILTGIVVHDNICISSTYADRLTKLALTYADELIRQLKEKEEK